MLLLLTGDERKQLLLLFSDWTRVRAVIGFILSFLLQESGQRSNLPSGRSVRSDDSILQVPLLIAHLLFTHQRQLRQTWQSGAGAAG